MPAATLSIIQYAVIDDLKNFRISTKDICRRNGVSQPTVYRIALKAGIDMAERDKVRISNNLRTFGPEPLSEHRDAVLISLREGMLTASEIAHIHGVSRALVQRVAREYTIRIGHKRILKGEVERLIRRKAYLEECLIKVDVEIQSKSTLLNGKASS